MQSSNRLPQGFESAVAGTEQDVCAWLKANPVVLRMGLAPESFATLVEYRLGSDYRADFLIARSDSNAFGVQVMLVECESPQHKLFTKSGDVTAALNHAIGQVRCWQGWIRANRSYFARSVAQALRKVRFTDAWKRKHILDYCLDGYVAEEYVIVIGRRASLSERDIKHLRNAKLSDSYDIITYDQLIERAEDVLRWLDNQ